MEMGNESRAGVTGRASAAGAGFVVALLLLSAAPSTARADAYISGMIFGTFGSLPLAAIGTAAALTVGLSRSDGGGPGLGSRVFAYISGGLNLAWSGFMFWGAADAHDNKGLWAAFALSNLVVGAVDLTLALVRRRSEAASAGPATAAPRAGNFELHLVPVAGADARGQPFAGLGLRASVF